VPKVQKNTQLQAIHPAQNNKKEKNSIQHLQDNRINAPPARILTGK